MNGQPECTDRPPRRQLIMSAGVGVATAAISPVLLFGQATKGIVPTMIDAAAQAKIETDPVRRHISVLEGSGGKSCVLTGNDGKLLQRFSASLYRSRS